LNVSGARRQGFLPQEAVGKSVRYNGSTVRIVGVLADTKMLGALNEAAPIAYSYIRNFPLTFSVRLRPDMVPQTLAFIDRKWHAFSPVSSILRQFIDDNFVTLYQASEREGQIFDVFAAIAIFIACLGLFGLAAFTVGRRTKEIGIRKVFGARISNVVILLLWQFSIPVLIANVIAWPLAWYYLHDWLQGFAYRITLSPLYFLGAGASALAIAWATVFVHAVRVARANPIHALRYE
jgi:putative ABC transport system permease protein